MYIFKKVELLETEKGGWGLRELRNIGIRAQTFSYVINTL
jgi:hypothetical protein